MPRDVEDELEQLPDSEKLKRYWEKTMRKAYNEFRDEYVKEINDLNRRLPDSARIHLEAFPQLGVILQYLRENTRAGEDLTAKGAKRLLIDAKIHGRPLFQVTPDNLPAMADEDIRKWVMKKKFEIDELFARFAKEVIKATRVPAESPGRVSWWSVFKMLDKIDKFLTWLLRYVDRVLNWLLGKEAPPSQPGGGAER